MIGGGRGGKPVHCFIIAAPRSGTTWISRILDAHPEIFCTERRLFGDYADFLIDEGSAAPRLRCTLDKFTKASLLPQNFTDYDDAGLLGSYIDALVTEEMRVSGKRVLIDKVTPYVGTAGLVVRQIERFFPDAKIVHLTRDGRDVVTSGVFHWMSRIKAGEKLSAAQEERRRCVLEKMPFAGRFFTDSEIDEWTRTWSGPLETMSFTQERFDTLHIRFESLLGDGATVLRDLLDFVGVGSDDETLRECLGAGAFERMSGGRKSGETVANAHVRKGIAGDWKNYFTKRDAKMFEEIAPGQLAGLGYEDDRDWADRLSRDVELPGESEDVMVEDHNHGADSVVTASEVLMACGRGRTLVFGYDPEKLVSGLRAAGVDAEGLEPNEGGGFSFRDGEFATVVSARGIECVDDEEIDRVLGELRRVGSGHAFFRISSVDVVTAKNDRAVWERRLFDAGFRRSVRASFVGSSHQSAITMVLENAVSGAHDAASAQSDCLRESGDRHVARLNRFVTASAFVRPNDRVLDLGCGAGEGAAILAANTDVKSVRGLDDSAAEIDYAKATYGGETSTFSRGGGQGLRELGDESVDVVLCLGASSVKLSGAMGEVVRVLTPAGRLIWWVSAGGEDLARITESLPAELLIEHSFAESERDAPTTLQPMGPEVKAEKILVVAMKDPWAKATKPYQETIFPSVGQAPQEIDFGGTYENPWLYRSLVARGLRTTNLGVLWRIANDTLDRVGPTPPTLAQLWECCCIKKWRVLA